METYRFLVVLRESFDLDLVERIYEVCDDSSVGSTETGATEIAFDRESESLASAMRTAVHDLRSLGLTMERIVIESESVALI